MKQLPIKANFCAVQHVKWIFFKPMPASVPSVEVPLAPKQYPCAVGRATMKGFCFTNSTLDGRLFYSEKTSMLKGFVSRALFYGLRRRKGVETLTTVRGQYD